MLHSFVASVADNVLLINLAWNAVLSTTFFATGHYNKGLMFLGAGIVNFSVWRMEG